MPPPRIYPRLYQAWISVTILVATTLSIHADERNGGDEIPWLPKSSDDYFLSSSSCADEVELFDVDGTNSFMRWVLLACHATRHPGWEVAIPNHFNVCHEDPLICNTTSSDEGPSKTAEGYYARVFDLLNTARQHNTLPTAINISNICHIGMEVEFKSPSGETFKGASDNIKNNFAKIPSKPNPYIPTEMWNSLWNTCSKKLLSNERVSSSCVDIPGIVVENPSPPLKVNNPCHLEYRMVDGAHRICLRKYIMNLLSGEILELEQQLKDYNSGGGNDKTELDRTQSQITIKQNRMDQILNGFFLVMNQSTFEPLLMNLDPHTTWAKSQSSLNDGLTSELKLQLEQWMNLVMDRVRQEKSTQVTIPQ